MAIVRDDGKKRLRTTQAEGESASGLSVRSALIAAVAVAVGMLAGVDGAAAGVGAGLLAAVALNELLSRRP